MSLVRSFGAFLVAVLVPAAVQASPRGPTVSVLGGYRATTTRYPSRAVEWRALLELTVPFDRFVTAPVWALPSALAEETSQGAEPTGETEEPSEPTPPAAPESPVVAVTPPLARRLVDAALRQAGHDSTEQRLDDLARRSRSAAGLPELRLRGGRSIDESLRLSPTTADPYRYTQAGGVDLFFEARLTWDLDRLVFDSQELSVERLRRQRASDRMDLVERVLEALFAWQRAQVEEVASRLPEERALARLERAEAAIILDVLTGGWFSEHLSSRGSLEGEDEGGQ